MSVGSAYLKIFLVFVSLLFFLSTVNAFVDVNINSPGMTDGNYISNNIAGGKVFIDFNYFDSNSTNFYPDINGYTLDFNIYYSSTAGTYSNAIVTDVNVTHAPDTNKTDGGADSNRYVWVWDTQVMGVADGNYFIDINVFNNSFDLNQNPNDLNVDTNSSGISIIIDNTNPTVTISSVATTAATKYGLTYTGTDATAGIKKYWVSDDNSTWIDNARNLSYEFTAPLSNQTFTFYLKSQDFADNNSSVASIVVSGSGGGAGATCGDSVCNFEIGETSSTCPSDCGAVCGDGSCTGTESVSSCPADCGPAVVCGNGTCESGETNANCPSDCNVEAPQPVEETVLTKTTEGNPTAEDILSILTNAGAEEKVENAVAAVEKTSVARAVKVVKETASSGSESFSTTLTVKVSNTSTDKLEKVTVIEEIPKSVAQSASQITSKQKFRVLLDDPIIEFVIDEIKVGQTVEVSYSVASEVKESDFEEYLAPVVSNAAVVKAPSCEGVTCNDNNSCTADSCFEGQCSFAPVADGTSCGFGEECKSGNCVLKPSVAPPVAPPPVQPPQNYTILIIVIILVVIVAGYFYYNKKK